MSCQSGTSIYNVNNWRMIDYYKENSREIMRH